MVCSTVNWTSLFCPSIRYECCPLKINNINPKRKKMFGYEKIDKPKIEENKDDNIHKS